MPGESLLRAMGDPGEPLKGGTLGETESDYITPAETMERELCSFLCFFFPFKSTKLQLGKSDKEFRFFT